MGVINRYHVGQGIDTTGTFKLSGSVADPTTVRAQVMDPSENITTYTYGVDGALTKQSTGVYALSFTVDEAGDWWYGYEGDGAVETTGEKRIYVAPSKLFNS